MIADVNGWFTDASSTVGGTDFTGITPTRILDTRDPGAGGPLLSGYVYAIQLRDRNGNPVTGVSAIVVNVTATDTTAAGYLTLYPDSGQTPPPPPPLASDLNFVAGQTVPNLVVLRLGPNAFFDIYNAGGDTDVVMDVVGFYGSQDAGVPSGTTTRAYAPARQFRTAPSR